MPISYTDLQTRVAKVLWDASNELFTASYIQDGIKQALDHYSKRRPLQAITTKTVTVDSPEQDVSNITGLIDISQVWAPYTAANPEYPPLVRPFEYWVDQKVLYFPYPYQPVIGDVIRIFYQALHTINGLSSATVTTIPLDDESPFAQGCAGYCVQARARATTEEVTLDGQVPVSAQLMKWSALKIKEMDAAIDMTLIRESGLLFVQMPRLDYYDKAWS